MIFNNCTGNCTDEGTHCKGCGRSHEEVAEMKEKVDELILFAQKMNYENTDDFANGVANTIKYKMGLGHN